MKFLQVSPTHLVLQLPTEARPITVSTPNFFAIKALLQEPHNDQDILDLLDIPVGTTLFTVYANHAESALEIHKVVSEDASGGTHLELIQATSKGIKCPDFIGTFTSYDLAVSTYPEYFI